MRRIIRGILARDRHAAAPSSSKRRYQRRDLFARRPPSVLFPDQVQKALFRASVDRRLIFLPGSNYDHFSALLGRPLFRRTRFSNSPEAPR